MDTGVQCNKEMVDLLMKIKKHLKVQHQISLNMSDPNLMTRLLQLSSIEDGVLQGMMRYLMALAGGNWNDRYLAATNKLKPLPAEKSFTEKFKEKMLADTAADHTGAAVVADQAVKVRYYRGQPVYG